MKSFIAATICTLSFGLSSTQGLASEATSEVMLEAIVSGFYLDQYNDKSNSDCPPNIGRCVDKVCDILSPFECKTQNDLNEVLRACRGNYGGSCVTTACNKLGHFGCDQKPETFAVATACRGNVDGSCLNYVCKRLGHFGCDSMDEIQPILLRCAGN